MTIEELIIDEQLPEEIRQDIKNNRFDAIECSEKYIIISFTGARLILKFWYDEHFKLQIK